MKGSLSKIQSNYKHINNYGVINDLNPEIDEYKHIYNNLLDKSVNIENLVYNKDFNTDITKNILLWKLREYNLSIEYFTSNLINIEMIYRKDINPQSRKELARYLSLLFMSKITNNTKLNDKSYNDALSNYILDILKYNKIIEGDYLKFRKFNELVCIIKNIHNTIVGDSNKYYMFNEFSFYNFSAFISTT